MFPEDLRYYREHEWVRVDGDIATIGISAYAQDALGDIVYLELPDVGGTVAAGDTFGEVESVKSVSQLFTPVSGEIVDANEDLTNAPETINSNPYDDGWMIKVRLSNAGEIDELMSAQEYQAFLEQ